MKAFLVNGNSLAGKDSFCKFVEYEWIASIRDRVDANAPIEFYERYRSEVQVISTIDPVKKIYRDFFGWDGIKTDEDRKNLFNLKQMWINVGNGPSKWLIDTLTSLAFDGCEIVFIMVREHSELMRAAEICFSICNNAQSINIVRDDLPVPPVEKKITDTFPEYFRYDWVIHNPTTENPMLPDLNKAAKEFVRIVQEDDFITLTKQRIWDNGSEFKEL